MSGHERERLSAYLDRELPPVEHAAVEAHLAACPECAAFLAELAAVDEAAAALPAEAPEGYFETFPARVRSRLQARKATVPARRLPAWAWAAAAVLLLAVVTPLTLRQLRPAPGAAPSTVPDQAAPAIIAAPPAAPVPVPAQANAPAVAPPPREAKAQAPKDEVDEGLFASRLRPAAPAVGGVPAQAAQADVEAVGVEGGVSSEAVESREQKRLRSAAAKATAEAVSPAPSETPVGAAAQAQYVDRLESGSRLDEARPRSASAWRLMRDEWNAFAAAETNPLRADEARVRAIEAAREAWRAGGDEADERAFRRAAAAYLQREDALQKPRVRRLLAEPTGTP